VLYPELQAAILGDKTPEQALETASKKATEIMEDAGFALLWLRSFFWIPWLANLSYSMCSTISIALYSCFL
jgi:hypothetical protein